MRGKNINEDSQKITNEEIEKNFFEEEKENYVDDEDIFVDEGEFFVDEEEKFVDEEIFRMQEPKNGGIKEWFEELNKKIKAKKQLKEELHNQNIYTKGDKVSIVISKYVFGLLTVASVVLFIAVLANMFMSAPLVASLIKLVVCAGVFGISREIYKEKVSKLKELKKVTEKEPKVKQNKKSKKNKKSKTKKISFSKVIKKVFAKNNKVSNQKENDNTVNKELSTKKKNKKFSLSNILPKKKLQETPVSDFEELGNIEEETIETKKQTKKTPKQKATFQTADILKVKLNKTSKKVVLKDCNFQYMKGYGVYFIEIPKENKNLQKFIKDSYKEEYPEERIQSFESNNKKVLVLNNKPNIFR